MPQETLLEYLSVARMLYMHQTPSVREIPPRQSPPYLSYLPSVAYARKIGRDMFPPLFVGVFES